MPICLCEPPGDILLFLTGQEAIDTACEILLVLIIVGVTGSGKTTQMTQYLAEAGYAARG
ncbi:hypothetical protein EDC04DRAFT_2899169 [Pisolithus marmoratus]|nr:hypothetical protein EDC04DRAFT_2899169 [Pisolithus marmoratus]